MTADAPPIAADNAWTGRPEEAEALLARFKITANSSITLNSSAEIGGASAVIGVSKAFRVDNSRRSSAFPKPFDRITR